MTRLMAVGDGDDVLLDLRYAGTDNLLGRPVYRRAVALLRPEALACLRAASRRAAAMGLRLKLFDAFRPVDAQWLFWEALPDPRYVADPRRGTGMHPRGAAVDVTLVERRGGAELDMGTGFDSMQPASAQDSLAVSADALRNRALLLGVMSAAGWDHIDSEWWHYQLPGAGDWPSLWARDVPDGPM